jgi:drug/metabolite transporter (DMT)-like permease
MLAVALIRPRGEPLRSEPHLFAIGGTCAGLGLLFLHKALAAEKVSLVTILASQPLPVTLLPALVLREIERFGLPAILAAIPIVIGNNLVLGS